MNEKTESVQAAIDYLDELIRIADKYEIERERFVKICLLALIATAETINFEGYRFGEGE